MIGRCVYVVDDDPSVRKALSRALRAEGFDVETFDGAEALLERGVDGAACLVCDVDMPGIDGLELQERLAASGADRPIVFLTGHGDIPMSVRAMRGGAVDFLSKPMDAGALVAAVRGAVEAFERERERTSDVRAFRERVETLTGRERDVLALVVAGRLNKQIALDLGIAIDTVKVHRGRVMRKTGVDSLAELVRLCERAGIPGPRD